MAVRFKKSVQIAKGVKVNVGKKSVGMSVGNKVGGVSVNSNTGTRVRASAPGTGVSYTQNVSSTKSQPKTKKPIYKKWWFWAIVAVVLICILVPSDDSEPEIEALNVEMSVEPNVNSDDGTVLFGIITNLPEDTKLLVTVTDENGYEAQDNTVVLNNGKAFTSEFSDHGKALSGKYNVEITMTTPSVQLQSVKDVVGENGENLAGQYVCESTIDSESLIRADFDFEF